MAEVSYTGQIIREAPEIEAYKLGLLKSARDLSQQQLSIPAYQAAELSNLQKDALKQGEAGIGSFAPFLQTGSEAIGQGMQLAQAGAQGAAGVNVAPEYQQAFGMLGAGAVPTAALGQYAGAAGAGMPSVATGMGTVGRATGMIPSAADLMGSQAMLQQAAQATGGATAGYNPAAAQAFMNPYQQAVTQQALGEMRRQADIARQGQAAQAVRAGAFGGTREGVQRAEFERGVQDIMGQRIMQDYAQNYGQAQQAAQQSFEAQQQRQLAGAGQIAGIGGALGQQQLSQAQLGQAGAGLLGQLGGQQAQMGLLPAQISQTQAGIAAQQAGLYGQLGQGLGSLAGQYGQLGLQQAQTLGQLGQGLSGMGVQQAALGQAAQELGQKDVQMLANLGTMQQQAEQNRLEALRATGLQKAMTPYQQLSFLSDIYKGAPGTQMSLTSTSAPSTSPLLQAVGLGISGLAAATGAQKAGLFG
jgi:hypothetical protein